MKYLNYIANVVGPTILNNNVVKKRMPKMNLVGEFFNGTISGDQINFNLNSLNNVFTEKVHTFDISGSLTKENPVFEFKTVVSQSSLVVFKNNDVAPGFDQNQQLFDEAKSEFELGDWEKRKIFIYSAEVVNTGSSINETTVDLKTLKTEAILNCFLRNLLLSYEFEWENENCDLTIEKFTKGFIPNERFGLSVFNTTGPTKKLWCFSENTTFKRID